MHVAAIPARPRGLALILHWPRVRFTMIASGLWGVLFSFHWKSGPVSILTRTMLIGLLLMTVFGLFEQWPRKLPRWLARWVLQVVGVAAAVPVVTAILYWLTTPPGDPAFYTVKERFEGYSGICMSALLFAPWLALGALVRQKDALARTQALAFELERSELERQALDARLRLLQAQVAPHFLFNTLANVQALVEAGSPQAPAVLRSLIAYLRAAVPRMNELSSTLGEELQLVQAYLELMHMRMPDRLQFAVHAEPDALAQRCPPMTLLTLVENAVRHGIDPSEEGGRIDLQVVRRGDRVQARVSDSGVGLRAGTGGLGTGLATLRERLALAFGNDARLTVSAQHPRGVAAELDLPFRVEVHA